jgi:hypothetical protein
MLVMWAWDRSESSRNGRIGSLVCIRIEPLRYSHMNPAELVNLRLDRSASSRPTACDPTSVDLLCPVSLLSRDSIRAFWRLSGVCHRQVTRAP